MDDNYRSYTAAHSGDCTIMHKFSCFMHRARKPMTEPEHRKMHLFLCTMLVYNTAAIYCNWLRKHKINQYIFHLLLLDIWSSTLRFVYIPLVLLAVSMIDISVFNKQAKNKKLGRIRQPSKNMSLYNIMNFFLFCAINKYASVASSSSSSSHHHATSISKW